MCVIVNKKENVPMPTIEDLQACWDTNSDGAGYMFPHNNQVIIRKGFMNFHSFYSRLRGDVKKYGEDIPYLLHFRISTHGGIKPANTHPFALSTDIKRLTRLDDISDMGVMHNGIITLDRTSAIDTGVYSDTMVFITEYMSKIVKARDFYKDTITLEILRRIVDSKLAIMDGSGTVTTVGNFTNRAGVEYSNIHHEWRTQRTDYSNYDDAYGGVHGGSWHDKAYGNVRQQNISKKPRTTYPAYTTPVKKFTTTDGKLIDFANEIGYNTQTKWERWGNKPNESADVFEAYIEAVYQQTKSAKKTKALTIIE